MYKHIYIIALLLGIITITTSCQKERIEILWEEIAIPTQHDLESVAFWNADTGYVVGGTRYEIGILLKTYDGGASWQSDSLQPVAIYDIDLIDAQTIYTLGHYGYMLQSYDAGATWLTRNLTPTLEAYWNIDFYSLARGAAAGGGAFSNGGVYLFDVNNEGRDTFHAEELHEMNDVVFVDAQTIVAVGFGLVKRSVDAGRSFEVIDIRGDNYVAVDFPSDQIGYAVGTSGAIIKSTDGGISWEKLNNANNVTAAQVKFADVIFATEAIGYAVGDNGTFWTTSNGGTDWQIVDNFPDVNITSIDFNNGVGYLTAEEGRLFRFFDE